MRQSHASGEIEKGSPLCVFGVGIRTVLTPTLAAIPDVQPLTAAEVIGIEAAGQVQYDHAGIPYIVTKPDEVGLDWGLGHSLRQLFVLDSTFTNLGDRDLIEGSIFVTLYDLDGTYMASDVALTDAPSENPLGPYNWTMGASER